MRIMIIYPYIRTWTLLVDTSNPAWVTHGLLYYTARLVKYLTISFPSHCIFLTAGKSKYTIVINWVLYGAINYCESIEIIFEMITFVV